MAYTVQLSSQLTLSEQQYREDSIILPISDLFSNYFHADISDINSESPQRGQINHVLLLEVYSVCLEIHQLYW